MKNIQSKKVLEQIIQLFASNTEKIWYKHLKVVNITKYLKDWWNKNCHKYLEIYRQYKQIKDWRRFKDMVKKMKHNFFDLKIQEITNKKCGLWKLMNWVKKCKLLAIEAIQYNSQPYIKLDNL